jgi:hypothetical protein
MTFNRIYKFHIGVRHFGLLIAKLPFESYVMYDWRHQFAPIWCPNYDIKESQYGFQIGVTKCTNLFSKLGTRVIVGSKLGIYTVLVLYFNKNNGADCIKRLLKRTYYMEYICNVIKEAWSSMSTLKGPCIASFPSQAIVFMCFYQFDAQFVKGTQRMRRKEWRTPSVVLRQSPWNNTNALCIIKGIGVSHHTKLRFQIQ